MTQVFYIFFGKDSIYSFQFQIQNYCYQYQDGQIILRQPNNLISIHNSMFQLQADIATTTENLRDMFILTSLNLQAVDLVFRSKSKSLSHKLSLAISNYNECESKRLQQMIKNQIYLEGDVQRRDRMKDYEDRIQIQRRLVTDKETNYMNLSKVKTLKSLYLAPEDYALVQMNKRRQQKQINTLHYKDNIESNNVLQMKQQSCLQYLKEQLDGLQVKRQKYQKLADHIQWITNKPQEYLNYRDKFQFQVDIPKQQTLTPSIRYNDLTMQYLNIITGIQKENKNLATKLQAKKSYTSLLQQQYQVLQCKYMKDENRTQKLDVDIAPIKNIFSSRRVQGFMNTTTLV